MEKCWRRVARHIRTCSLAMDDGGRCLLDVIDDPLLLQSFLESGSDDNSKDPQDGTSSESAVESPQISRNSHVPNHSSSVEHVVEPFEQMGYSYPIENNGLLAHNATCSIATGLGVGLSFVVASSVAGSTTYQHASSSGATIHHIPSSSAAAQSSLHQPSPVPTRSVTPLSQVIKSPSQGPPSVHSMPPPSPLQQTRSPLPPHTPSPAPPWSPAPPVLSPATSRTQSSMPSISLQQSHNQLLQTSNSVTHFVQALATQQSISQKLSLQQQQLLLHPQVQPASQQSLTTRLPAVASPVTTTTASAAALAVAPPVVQIIPAQPNVSLPVRTSQSSVRPIQPKLPQQILPKPTGASTNQFVTPMVKQSSTSPASATQRAVGVGLQSGTGQLVIGQGQTGVFAGPQGTFVLNQIIPAVGQSPILIQNLSNLQGVQLTLRPPSNPPSGQTVSSSGGQNNATLIAALQGPNQPAQALFTQTKSAIHGQQTIVIPNNIAHAGLTPPNLNLTTSAIPSNSIVPSASQGQGFLTRSNIIFSPRVMAPNQGLQLQHIQTPQGPILALAPSQPIALPHVQTAIQNTALSGPQLAHGAVPVHGVVAAGQGVISGLPLQAHQPHTALPQHHPQQSLFASTTVPFTSHLDHSSNQQLVQGLPPASSQPITTSVSSAHSTLQQIQLHNEDSSPKKPATPASKPTKVPSVNLEELLKEHGIVPENAESTPPPSPDSQSPQSDDVVPTQLSTCSSTANSPQVIATLQPQHQVVVEQLSQIPHSSSSLPQLKFALAQDGSVILQPHSNFSASKAQPPPDVHEISVSMKTKSLVLPVVTSPPVPVVSTVASSVGHSTLLARLNAAPAISVPDIVSSLALATGLVSSTPSSSTVTTTVTTTTSALIPITVQSLNVTSTPITCSQVSDAVTSFSSPPSVVPKQTPTSEISVAVTHSRNSETSNVGGSPCSSQNVQKRMNHVIFGLQSVISPSQQHTAGITVQAVSKVVPTSSSSSSSEDVCVENSLSGPPTVQKADKNGQTETCIVGVSDNSNAVIAPSHKVQTVSTAVPNQIFLRLQDEIEDLAQKNLSSDQQHYFQQLLLVQQKINLQPNKQPKCPRSRNTQSAFQNEEDKEPIYSKSFVSNQAAVITMPQKQSHLPPLQDQQQNTGKPVASHNIHLVNLLKQNSVHNSSARYIPPSATSAATHCDTTPVSSHAVSSHMRVGSQHVSVGQQQHHPLQHQVCNSLSNDQIQQSQQAVMLRVQQSNQQLPSNASHSNVMQHLQNEPPVSRAPSVPPVSKTVLISKQLALDQSGGLNPDTKTPFRSKEDACRRLLNYHVFNSRVPSVEDIKKADQTFDMVAKFLLDKSQKMSNKYHGLLLRDSMRPCPTPERVMLERLFIQDETQSLECDKAAVADGKELVLPPLPEKWLKESSLSPDIQAVEEGDHLEAPVIDSCVEILSPQHGDDCERSPPTLKRISIKPDRFSDRELEEPVSKKRSKLLPTSVKMESSEGDWCEESSVCNSPCSKACETDGEALHCQSESVHCQANYPKDNREEDMMTKLRKELNISPLNEDFNETDIHVDFDPPSETGGLADFEPPVARTEESCDSTLLTVYSNGTRTNSEVKYDYMLDCSSEWAEAYANHASDKTVSESQAAVESILSDQHNPSDLDLSGIEGLDDHLDESQQSIPNGIPDDNEESRESELNYIDFPIFKQTSCRKDNPQVQSEQSEGVQDQMQSAIKSILELPPENCSYISGPETEANPRACGLGKGSGSLKKSTYEMSAVHYGVNLDADMGMTGNEPDAALDEAVRSILQN